MTWRDMACGELDDRHRNRRVTLAGWVHELRSDAGVVTIELRDSTGLATLVVDGGARAELAATAASVTPESVVQACGEVMVAVNGPYLQLDSLRVISAARVVPYRPEDPTLPTDDFGPDSPRLRHRWLHLRSRQAQSTLRLRSRIASTIRRTMEEQGFIEVETPLLYKPMPMGGDDLLVATREAPGELFGMPQSPTFYKELLTIGGLDRYYQIARAFRDEPVGPYRLQELTQFDLEMNFVTREDIYNVVETVVTEVWRTCLGVELEAPFPRITWADALRRFGTDRPDLRYDVEITGAPGGFAGVVAPGIPTAADEAELAGIDQEPGVTGFGLAVADEDGALRTSNPELTAPARHLLDGRRGAVAVVAWGEDDPVRKALGRARTLLAARLGLAVGGPRFIWVVDFPLFVWSDQHQRFLNEHNPFTAPSPESAHLIDSDPGAVTALRYDLVCNGLELASGALRVGSSELQAKVFDVMGLPEDVRRFWLGPYLDALETGVPPRGGLAMGLDRLVMMALGAADVRSGIAFPKSLRGRDEMSGAPCPVPAEKLLQVGLQRAEDA